jgi:hypothetical protein
MEPIAFGFLLWATIVHGYKLLGDSGEDFGKKG